MSAQPVVGLAVFLSVCFVVVFLMIIAATGGEYLLTLHTLHAQEAASMASHIREMTAQLRAALPTCHALQALDNASHPPVVNASHNPLSYGHKLAQAIHQVYQTSQCRVILNGVAHHESLTQILKQIQKG